MLEIPFPRILILGTPNDETGLKALVEKNTPKIIDIRHPSFETLLLSFIGLTQIVVISEAVTDPQMLIRIGELVSLMPEVKVLVANKDHQQLQKDLGTQIDLNSDRIRLTDSDDEVLELLLAMLSQS